LRLGLFGCSCHRWKTDFFLNSASIKWLAAASIFCIDPAIADESRSGILAGAEADVLAYIDYSAGQSPLADDAESNYNRFTLTRGYFTVKKSAQSWFGVRITLDATQDNTGDFKVREKYLYAELKAEGTGPFTDLKSEIGMGHIPWLDFEEHINPYRCQGTMAIERAGVFNSADLGVSLSGNFSGKLQEAKARTGSSSYDGHYGSWHIGIYNGGGYHAPENNINKTIEGRLTARPLPESAPGLQLSYFTIRGKGNVIKTDSTIYPDYLVHLGMISYENPRVTATGQIFITEGNAGGAWIDTTSGKELSTQGVSVFANINTSLLQDRLSVFGRYDMFDADTDDLIAGNTSYTMIFGGLAYDLYRGNLLLVTFETTDYESDSGGKGKLPSPGLNLGDDQKFQIVYQLKI